MDRQCSTVWTRVASRLSGNDAGHRGIRAHREIVPRPNKVRIASVRAGDSPWQVAPMAAHAIQRDLSSYPLQGKAPAARVELDTTLSGPLGGSPPRHRRIPRKVPT